MSNIENECRYIILYSYNIQKRMKNVQLSTAINMQLHFGLQNVDRGTHNEYLNSTIPIENTEYRRVYLILNNTYPYT